MSTRDILPLKLWDPIDDDVNGGQFRPLRGGMAWIGDLRTGGNIENERAEFIVLAGNAHDDLLAACVEAVDQLRFYDRTVTIKNHDAALIASLDAAIAKAKA